MIVLLSPVMPLMPTRIFVFAFIVRSSLGLF